MKIRVAQANGGDPVERRRGNHAPKGARRAEADIVSHNQEDVRCALWRHDPGRPPGFGLPGVEVYLAASIVSQKLWLSLHPGSGDRYNHGKMCPGESISKCTIRKGPLFLELRHAHLATLAFQWTIVHRPVYKKRRLLFGKHFKKPVAAPSNNRASTTSFGPKLLAFVEQVDPA
jgi:hypothetical protein